MSLRLGLNTTAIYFDLLLMWLQTCRELSGQAPPPKA